MSRLAVPFAFILSIGVHWAFAVDSSPKAVAVLGAASDPRSDSTKRMAARLERVAETTVPLNTRFLAAGQVAALKEMLRSNPALQQEPAFRFRYGDALLNAGLNDEALAQYVAIEASGPPITGANKLNLRLNQALCHLRNAEQVNCVSNHNADSCLLPLQGGGIHRWPEHSQRAIGILTQLLEEFPESLAARWLLNVASMTVGAYPQGVPGRWLIPTNAFASDAPMPRFREVATLAGLAPNELSGGSIVDDFDGDELLDVVVTSIGLRDPMRFYRNDGNGRFTDRSREAGLEGLVGGLNLVQADFDNDGHLDLFVLRGAWLREEGKHPNSLLRNRGNGTFDDVTESAGVLSFHPTQTAVWLDFDGDGWLDLFVGNESVPGQSRHPCELYWNRRDGTFVDIARLSGVTANAYVKGVTAGDLNNDGRPDLYLSVLGGQNRLFRNDGPKDAAKGPAAGWNFTDIAVAAGVTEPVQSFPCWFFDYDNDGWEDLWVSGYRIDSVGDIAADYLRQPHRGAKAKLYRNRDDGTFADVSAQANVDRLLHAMGSNFGDVDGDGWLDFYLGTGDPDLLTIIPNRMYRNADGLRFQDVTTAAGLGHLQKGHGVSMADIDNDGDVDIHEDMGGAMTADVYPNVLFENPGFQTRWLKLRLVGVKANRSAIGARIRADFQENGKRRSVHRTVGSGGSFGANPLRVELGLGNAERLLEVSILWPGSGTRQVITGLELDRGYRITEGKDSSEVMPLKSFRFPAASTSAHDHRHHH